MSVRAFRVSDGWMHHYRCDGCGVRAFHHAPLGELPYGWSDRAYEAGEFCYACSMTDEERELHAAVCGEAS